MTGISIVGISGNLSRPSRTSAVVSAVLGRAQERFAGKRRLIELIDISSTIFAAQSYDQLSGEGRAIIDTIETADLLVVGSPVYRGSYTGAFKHLFDLVRHDRLAGKPIAITATGGSHMHALVTEHQLRPLFGFFSALSLPTVIYATEHDFRDYKISNPAIEERIGRVVSEAAAILDRRRTEPLESIAVHA